LGRKGFYNYQKVEEVAERAAGGGVDTVIQKLVPRLQKCPDLDGDYIGK
jgi:hypothetical protein